MGYYLKGNFKNYLSNDQDEIQDCTVVADVTMDDKLINRQAYCEVYSKNSDLLLRVPVVIHEIKQGDDITKLALIEFKKSMLADDLELLDQ